MVVVPQSFCGFKVIDVFEMLKFFSHITDKTAMCKQVCSSYTMLTYINKHWLFQIYESTQSLRIGFYVDNGLVKAVPACERAVGMAKQALEALGHTVWLLIKCIYQNT